MAKTRAQRKAERRAREAQQQRQAKRADRGEAAAQHDTQVPVSGEVAEAEAVEAGIGAHAPESALETPDAPAPSRAKPPKPSRAERRAAEKARKEEEKRARDEQRRRERERLARKEKQAGEERQRGAVIGFIVSCWAELKRVQWPDRDTLVQASAVTIVFVAIAAAYLGALDGAFNWLVNRIL